MHGKSNNLSPEYGLYADLIYTQHPRLIEFDLEELVSQKTGQPLKVGIVAARTSCNGTDTNRIKDVILAAARTGSYDIILAPEYSFLPESGPLTKKELDRHLYDFKDASRTGSLIIPGTFVWNMDGTMLNSCFAYHKGKETLCYHKRKDGGDTKIASKYNLKAQFGKLPGYTDWEGFRIGVEICEDSGTLYKSDIDDRDIVFLISCGISSMGDSIKSTRKGGYVIVADGALRAYHFEQNQCEPIKSTSTINSLISWLNL